MTPPVNLINLCKELSATLPLLASFFAVSRTVHLVRLNSDGIILFVNNALKECLRVGDAELAGESFSGFLTKADGTLLAARLSDKDAFSDREFLLNVVDSEQVPHTLRCRLLPLEDGCMILGEPPLEGNRTLQEELLQLNNQLTVLSRENIRKGRELANTVKKLEEAHEQLDKSFWHLRKIQEVLPICMECGKVKTADASWEDVVSYLKKNSRFLSHGYCPECVDKVMNRYKNQGISL